MACFFNFPLSLLLKIQVWAGNEACEPVTWRECKLVPRQVDFKVPKVDCVEGEPIPYTDCEDAEKVQMTTRMTCEVRHTTDCRPVASTKCQTIEYQVRCSAGTSPQGCRQKGTKWLKQIHI